MRSRRRPKRSRSFFWLVPDPVAGGLVASLNRPGANLTGVKVLSTEVIAKNLELLHELVPAAAVIAVLVHPDNSLDTEAVTGGIAGCGWCYWSTLADPESRQPK